MSLTQNKVTQMGRHEARRSGNNRSRTRRDGPSTHLAMPSLTDLTDRVERLLLRHDELKRTNALLQEQVQGLGQERDSLRSRLNAARARIDALLERLPVDNTNSNDAGKTTP